MDLTDRIYLRPLWRWRGRGRCDALADTPFAMHCWEPGAMMPSTQAGLIGLALRPLPWTARLFSALRWRPCPRACNNGFWTETGLTLDDLDWVVCHQANSRIIDHCIKHLNADPAKFYKNMDRYGNTSAASIPMALDELAEAGTADARPAGGLHGLWRRASPGAAH